MIEKKKSDGHLFIRHSLIQKKKQKNKVQFKQINNEMNEIFVIKYMNKERGVSNFYEEEDKREKSSL